MQMGMKLATAVVLVSGLSVTSAMAQDCTPKHEFETIEKGKLSVALTNTPPYSQEEGGAIAGIDGDLVKLFAKENCLDITYEIFTYPAAVSAVQSERADIAIGGFYRTAAREKVVTLSTPVYLDQIAVASVDGLDTVDQLLGKKVGTVEGYAWVLEMEETFEGSGTYPSSLNLAQDLQAGRIDAALEGFGAAVVLNKGTNVKVKLLKADDRIGATTNASQTSFLLSKTNEAFVSAVNATINEHRSQGVIAKTLETYSLDPSAADVGEGRVIQ
ncbi:MAG: transporter substrate-binding domain-containing protein [Alphaproteobacteria bacterium]|nr:amino acid ABC transporter substrate-binding protein [Rhizobiaceae bacterium]MBU3962641.1 transporter substrate-binding domain-containing protein [Alphaproteobacteria bacterium]MBU4090262.1 transporter substrate-binding domain-containing protein [Alphaproteobacteria bacterium]